MSAKLVKTRMQNWNPCEFSQELMPTDRMKLVTSGKIGFDSHYD